MTATERRQLLPLSLSLPFTAPLSLCLPRTAPFSYSSQAQFKRLFARQLCVNLHLHGAVNATQTRSRTRLMEARSSMQPLPIHPLPPLPLAVPVCTSLNWLSIAKQTQHTKQSETKRKKDKSERKNAAEFILYFFELPLLLLLLLLGIWYDMLISKCLHIYSIWLTCSCFPINRSVCALHVCGEWKSFCSAKVFI